MQAHRLVRHADLDIKSFDSPFSSFDFVENEFQGSSAIHRCFSLARSFSAQSMVIEAIPPVGLIAQENDELDRLGLASTEKRLCRLSFWDAPVASELAIESMENKKLIGYAILKRDRAPQGTIGTHLWHVFEAVFRKYEHSHNCVPGMTDYQVRVGEGVFTVTGVLYCQQNGLNKACAHVALRSLLSRLANGRDVSYAEMNQVAGGHATEEYRPGNGLNVCQIRAILNHYRVNYRDVDYQQAEKNNADVRRTQPYQKYLYAGIESGCGGLLGFSMDGPRASADSRHIIPFYGHTFNKDTWVPDAQVAYFNIGGKVGYIPSESWTSSFIGHDDNFGPNFCIPRLYVKPEHAQYVVEILRPDVAYNGMVAEAQALHFLYSIYREMDVGNPWQRRLADCAHPNTHRVVLRALSVTREQYLSHLKAQEDWSGNKESVQLLTVIGALLPRMLWMVEVSIPQLFPANERKLGEIVLDASRPNPTVSSVDFGLFVLARLPGRYVVISAMKGKTPSFITAPSGLGSHCSLFKQ